MIYVGDKKVRVLQVNAVYGIGSTGVIVEDIHKLSIEKGIESYVAYSTTNRSAVPNGYRIGNNLGKKIHALFSRINGKQAYFSRNATVKFLRYIDEIKPDIVHLHNLHSNYINLNMLLKYLAEKDIKTVVTLHDCWFYTGGCFHYTSVDCYKWMDGCGNCPKKMVDTPAYLFDCSKKILDDRKKYFSRIKNLTVTGVSQWILDEAKRGIFHKNNGAVIYNGVDTEVFCPTASDVRKKYNSEDKFVILAPANKMLSPVNKVVFEKVVESIDENTVMWLLACPKDKRGDLSNNVIPIDFVTEREELIKLYSAADVMLNPTREESLSLLNVECMSCGTPVITFKNTGVKETVDNHSSFAVENEDTKAILVKLNEIKEKGKAYYSADCRKNVAEKFEKKKNYNRYIELYTEISN